MYYEAKPVIVNAIQFTGNNMDEVREFCPHLVVSDTELLHTVNDSVKVAIVIHENDYIVKECDNIKVYNSEEFNNKYKPVSGRHHCSICNKYFNEYPNNTRPVTEGYCCDECCRNVVIPKRMELARIKINSDVAEQAAENFKEYEHQLESEGYGSEFGRF